MSVQIIPTRMHSATDSERDKKQTHKHHIFAPTASARSSISPKLCTVMEDVEIIKMLALIFRSNA